MRYVQELLLTCEAWQLNGCTFFFVWLKNLAVNYIQWLFSVLTKLTVFSKMLLEQFIGLFDKMSYHEVTQHSQYPLAGTIYSLNTSVMIYVRFIQQLSLNHFNVCVFYW